MARAARKEQAAVTTRGLAGARGLGTADAPTGLAQTGMIPHLTLPEDLLLTLKPAGRPRKSG